MKSLLQKIPAPRKCLQRLGYARRMALYYFCAVLVLSLLCAVYAYSDRFEQTTANFRREADATRQLAEGVWTRQAAPERDVTLRSCFQLNTSQKIFDQLALLIGDKIAIAHHKDWEGSDPGFVIGRHYAEVLKNTPAGQVVIHQNTELDRLEAFAMLGPYDAPQTAMLYLSKSLASVRGESWAAFLDVMLIGCILAVGAGLLVCFLLQKSMITPLAKLQEHIESAEPGAQDIAADLGELQELAETIQAASHRLMQAEAAKQTELKIELDRVGDESVVQTELLQTMVKDLRTSMSAVLGHSELLLGRDTRSANRINYVRAIQDDARRMSRLAHGLQELLPPIAGSSGDKSKRKLPISQLRKVIEELRQERSSTLQVNQHDAQNFALDAIAEASGAAHEILHAAEDEVAPPTRLSGSVLVVGRRDELSEDLIRELSDIGIQAIWVPDTWAADQEFAEGGHDLVIVNLSTRDRATLDLLAQIRQRAKNCPLIALLPEMARGGGGKFLDLGCLDFIYAPITRQGLLAVVGKFLDFLPLEPSPPDAAE